MAHNPTNVLVPQDGSLVYLGPVGTPLPDDHEAAVDAAFEHIGYISEDGPSLNPSERETSELRDWLGRLVKIINTTVDRSVTLPLMETTREALRLAFDGGTFTDNGAGGVKFVPGSEVQERAILIHMVEGDSVFRLGIKRAIVSEVSEVSPSAEDGTTWEITFTKGDPGDDTDGLEIQTNLPGVVTDDGFSS